MPLPWCDVVMLIKFGLEIDDIQSSILRVKDISMEHLFKLYPERVYGESGDEHPLHLIGN